MSAFHGPAYKTGYKAAKADLKKYGTDHIGLLALCMKGSTDWFDIGYMTFAAHRVEQRST